MMPLHHLGRTFAGAISSALLFSTLAAGTSLATETQTTTVPSTSVAPQPQNYFVKLGTWYTPHENYFSDEGACERYGEGFLARNPYAVWYQCYRQTGQVKYTISIYIQT